MSREQRGHGVLGLVDAMFERLVRGGMGLMSARYV